MDMNNQFLIYFMLKVFGQNQRASMIEEWVQFQVDGREYAWKEVTSMLLTVTRS